MLEKQCDDLSGFAVIIGIEAELTEAFVLAHQIRGRTFQPCEDLLQRLARGRMLQILDSVELDAALAQKLDCAARVSSARVMINGYDRHIGWSSTSEYSAATVVSNLALLLSVMNGYLGACDAI